MHYSRRTWCCPFYRYDEKNKVHCEGGSVFCVRDKSIFAAHADKYCGNAKGWRLCQIAVALEEFYEKRERMGLDDWT